MGTPRPCFQCKYCGHLINADNAWYYKREDNTKFVAHTENKHKDEFVMATLADPKFDIRDMYNFLR